MCSRCRPHSEFERAFLVAVKRARREHSQLDQLRGVLAGALAKQGFAPK